MRIITNIVCFYYRLLLLDEGMPDSTIGKALEAFRRFQQEQRSRTVSSQQYEEDEQGTDYEEGGYHIGLSRRRPHSARVRILSFNLFQIFIMLYKQIST